MIRATHKSGFTLIELMVSIAVFLILLVMMLQFLSGTQQIWKGTSGRGDVFVESKAAMDLVCSLLRETYYAEFKDDANADKQVLFRITRNNGDDKVYFVARSTESFGVDSINDTYVFRIGRNDNALQIMGIPAVYKDSSNKFVVSAAYQKAIDGNWDTAMCNAMDTQSNGTADPKGETIIERVTGLDFYPIYRKADGSLDMTGTPQNRLPVALMVQIKMLDRHNYELYQELPAADQAAFRKANELTFSRILYFDNRNYVAQ